MHTGHTQKTHVTLALIFSVLEVVKVQLHAKFHQAKCRSSRMLTNIDDDAENYTIVAVVENGKNEILIQARWMILNHVFNCLISCFC